MTQVCLIGFPRDLVNYVLVFRNLRSFDAIFLQENGVTKFLSRLSIP